MHPKTKTSGEWVIMNYFTECYTGFPEGRLIKSESPDFVLKSSSKHFIGLELTRLHYPDKKPTHRENKRVFNSKELTRSLLQEIIQKKEEKLPGYRDQYIQICWLIIHADILEGPASYNLKNKIEKWKFNTRFEKVFLFDLYQGKIYALV